MTASIPEARVVLTAREFVLGSLIVTARRYRVALVVLPGIFLAALVFESVATRGAAVPLRVWVSTAGWFVAIPLLLGFGAWRAYRHLPDHNRLYTWRFYPDRIETTGEKASAQLQWGAFTRIEETGSLLFFYVQRNLAHLVPKRAFGSAQEIDAVRRLAISALGKKAHVRSSEPG